jgi:hypothetical protein
MNELDYWKRNEKPRKNWTRLKKKKRDWKSLKWVKKRMKRGSREGRKKGEKRMNWLKRERGDYHILLLEELGSGLVIGTGHHSEMTEVEIGEGMMTIGIDVISIGDGMMIGVIHLVDLAQKGIGPVWVQEERYVVLLFCRSRLTRSPRSNPPLTDLHIHHRPHPSLHDYVLHLLAELFLLVRAHHHPELEAVIPIDPIGMDRVYPRGI